MANKDYFKEVQTLCEDNDLPLADVFKLTAICQEEGISKGNLFKAVALLIGNGWTLTPPSPSPSGYSRTNGKAEKEDTFA